MLDSSSSVSKEQSALQEHQHPAVRLHFPSTGFLTPKLDWASLDAWVNFICFPNSAPCKPDSMTRTWRPGNDDLDLMTWTWLRGHGDRHTVTWKWWPWPSDLDMVNWTRWPMHGDLDLSRRAWNYTNTVTWQGGGEGGGVGSAQASNHARFFSVYGGGRQYPPPTFFVGCMGNLSDVGVEGGTNSSHSTPDQPNL